MIDEDVKEPFKSEYAIEYMVEIEKMFQSTPDGRKKKEYQAWKDEINRMIGECNKLGNHKIYKPIK